MAWPASAKAIDGSLSVEALNYLQGDGPPSGTVGILGARLEASRQAGPGEFVFKGVARIDLRDDQGSYADLPIAKYTQGGEAWRLDIGFDTVFWGVAESQRVVNVVNQPDLLRSLRADVTFGQPMVAMSWFNDHSKLEAYVLPWFRERRFGGSSFRTGLPWPVDEDRPIFEHRRGERHVDHALRASTSQGGLDAGVSVFSGTLREPGFVPDAAARVLRPYYRQGTQWGVDAQYTLGPTLFKLELKHVRPRTGTEYGAAVYGIEQVMGRLGEMPFELSAFLEHNWDSRGRAAPGLYQNDLFTGLRLDFADTASTTLTLGVFHDLDHGSKLGRAVLETRLHDQWMLYAEAYVFHASDVRDAMFRSRHLDQITVRLTWNF